MIKTHKIKLYPNATMRRELERLFNYRRFCWNQALETWNSMYDGSLVMADKTLRPNERKVRDELVWNKADWQYEQSARVLQLVVNDLSKAWKNYFNSKMPGHDDYHCYQCGVKLRRDENAVENLIAYAKSKVTG
ncbi:hypothetical protein CHT97_01315 [Lacticaseibacillus chiayiensis]|nr:hypothetical protein CHT97_01315 [Lacticaseibacillus chiayiensis]